MPDLQAGAVTWVRSPGGLWHVLRADTTGQWSSAVCGRNLQANQRFEGHVAPTAECSRCRAKANRERREPLPDQQAGVKRLSDGTSAVETCVHGSLDPTGRGCSACIIEHLRRNLGEVLYAVSRSSQPRRFRWRLGRLEAEGIFENDPEWVVIIDGVDQYHERWLGA